MASALMKSFDFTTLIGRREGEDDNPFDDVIKGFPSNQKIDSISKIEIYFDDEKQDDATVVGLKIYYKLSGGGADPVSHGLVDKGQREEFTINASQIIVGCLGQLKDAPTKTVDGRIASISFVLFDTCTAELITKGPFEAGIGSGKAWGTFGHIVAFQGTTLDEVGITTLGFTKAHPGNIPIAWYP